MSAKHVAPAWLLVALVCVYGCRVAGRRESSGSSGGGAVLFDRPDTDAPASIIVHSPAFADGSAIPDRYADYGGKVSPALDWSGVPAGAKSVAVVVEDPDAPPPRTPYVHWVLYELPPGVTRLPESLPRGERLNEPAGALQGKNDAGSTGYFGPRPPPGGPHHYHFQVFALDPPRGLRPARRATTWRPRSGGTSWPRAGSSGRTRRSRIATETGARDGQA